MEITIVPEDIDKFVREALIKSAIGKNVEEIIKEQLASSLDSYNSNFRRAVTSFIAELVALQLEKHKDDIMLKIAERLTPETVTKIVSYGVDRFEEEMRNSRDY